MYTTILLILLLPDSLGLINNRLPQANYVIPIYDDEVALVHCISYFAETIFQESRCTDRCSLTHARYCCCKAITARDTPAQLRCTSQREEWKKDDPNIPFIDVSVVRRKSRLEERNETDAQNRTIALSGDMFYCNHQSNVSHLTAGSHIGLGWTIISAAKHDQSEKQSGESPTAPTDSFAASENPVDHYNDRENARHKETQFSSYYAHGNFLPLWISEDIKVELKPHNATFECNETEYVLPRGSSCLTPSRRAIFVMTNCGVVERVFIVIGVIILLMLAYVVFNILVWMWDYVMHFNSSKHKDRELLL